jgi:hypothetical protein
MKQAGWLTVVLTLAACGPASAQQTEVFVLASIGSLHEKVEGFRYQTLDRIIRAIRPDVMILEVTPEELAERRDTKGRPEYPNVVWPMLTRAGAPRAYAMEAGQPLYAALVRDGDRIWSEFARQQPDVNAALTAYTAAVTDVLLQHWKTAADTQDELTDLHARARDRLIGSLFPAGQELQARWDKVMVDAVRQAIAENRGKRVLVLGTHRNRFMFVDALRTFSGTTVVDMNRWLLANTFDEASARPDRRARMRCHSSRVTAGGFVSCRRSGLGCPPDPRPRLRAAADR